jgi:M6 family metalloprotease-like protein
MRFACLIGLLMAATAIVATEPPRPGTDTTTAGVGPDGVDPSRFTFRRALLPLMETLRQNRRLAAGAEFDSSIVDLQLGPTAVKGEKRVPVFLVKYKETSQDPYPPANLETELFSEEWPIKCTATATCTGTMRQYYREISYGQFTVTGTVDGWTKLKSNADFYEGKDYVGPNQKTVHCNGVCNTNQVGQMIQEALDAHPDFAWELYDNDGPDGIPNSGDDDGFVDFVAFVHPESGGECNDGNASIWSHRWNLTALRGSDYTTKRNGKSGAPIRIDDYVIMPAFACNRSTMIQIGVFAHEFGHAFGLPDLYDTTGKTSGLGNWCLMASGSWGGDGKSPDRPSHMSPWAKSFLGWISLQQVTGDVPARLDSIESHPIAIKIPISAQQYYIVSNERRQGFDSRLPEDGLAVWKVNQHVVDTGLRNNTVNAGPNKGVELIEADGLQRLNNPKFRGGQGDLFPGPNGVVRIFDNASNPKSIGRAALCDIGDPDDPMAARAVVSAGNCHGLAAALALVADPMAPPIASVNNLLSPAAFAPGATVRLVGKIENTGSNYFKPADRKFVISDARGNAIDVILPQVLESPQPSLPTPGTPAPAPLPTVASTIGHQVEVTGVVTRTSTGQTILKVLSVKDVQ